MQLRSLSLTTSVAGDGAAAGTLLGLANLPAMSQLTRLTVVMGDRRGEPFQFSDEAFAVAAMQPTASALASLTNLCVLELSGWAAAAGPAAQACWQALASALPTLPHLATLNLYNVPATRV